MLLLSLEFQAICASFVLAFTISRNNKGVCFTCLFFGNFPDPRGLGSARTLTYAWLYPRQSQASLRGYYGGNPRTSPKNCQHFFEKFPYLSFSHTWEKRTRGISNYGTRPAESWGRLRLQDTPPPHHLAEVYQSHIREHEKRVKKTRARTHKASMGHTVDLQLPMSYIYKYYYDKVLTHYMGSEAQTTYRLSSPPCGSSAALNSAMGGVIAIN